MFEDAEPAASRWMRDARPGISDSARWRLLEVCASAIDVIGAAGDPFEARDRIQQLHPDVLTLDVENGAAGDRRPHDRSPTARPVERAAPPLRQRLMRDRRIIDQLARTSPTEDLPRTSAQRARSCALRSMTTGIV